MNFDYDEDEIKKSANDLGKRVKRKGDVDGMAGRFIMLSKQHLLSQPGISSAVEIARGISSEPGLHRNISRWSIWGVSTLTIYQ